MAFISALSLYLRLGFFQQLLSEKFSLSCLSLCSNCSVAVLSHVGHIALAPEIHEEKVDVCSYQLRAAFDVRHCRRVVVQFLCGGLRRGRYKVVQAHKDLFVTPVQSQLARVQSILDTRKIQVLPIVIGGIKRVLVQSVRTGTGISVTVRAVVMEHDDLLKMAWHCNCKTSRKGSCQDSSIRRTSNWAQPLHYG